MTVFEHTVPLTILLAALLAGLLAGGLSAWVFLPRNLGNALLATLYLLILAALAWCLLLPGRKDSVTRTLKPRFVVALDTSQSMTLKPPGVAEDRWTVANRALQQPWTELVAADCDLEIFPFSSDVRDPVPLPDAADLVPDGAATLLRDGVDRIFQRLAGVDVAGALVLSDGIDTREAFSDWAGRERPFPVYTLRLEPAADWLAEPDLRIDGISTARRVTAGFKTELKVRISGQGSRGAPISVQLFQDEKLVQEKPTQIPDAGGERELVFELDHPQTGTFHYKAFVAPLPGEKNTGDNEHVVPIQVTDARNRLLYVEGIPRWEYKFLRRVLLAQEGISPAIFYTGADGTPQSGFEAAGVTADMTARELDLINIVLLGNVDAKELGDARAANLVEFVDQGGSLVLLGGSSAWAAGGIFQTPLGGILPVRSEGMQVLQAQNPFPAVLTDVARGHPAFAGDPELWQIIPPVLSVFSGARLTPGAQTLAEVVTPAGALPLVATQRYGEGKVAVILTDSLWRWQLGPEATRSKPYQRFWTQLIAWLLPQQEDLAKDRLEIFAEREELYLGEEMEIHARIGGENPASPAGGMKCILTLPEKREVPFEMAAKQVATPSGKVFPGFGFSFTAETPGLYQAVASAVLDGKTVASESLSFYVRPFSPETRPRPVNTDVLTAMAEASGGRFFESIEELNQALSALEPDALEEATSEFRTLWRNWLMVSLLMGLLTLSWGLRKFRNMP